MYSLMVYLQALAQLMEMKNQQIAQQQSAAHNSKPVSTFRKLYM